MPAMTEENGVSYAGGALRKRKQGNKNSRKVKKKAELLPGTGEKVKIDRKMKKLFRKRARQYNSDDDEDEDSDAGKPARTTDYKGVSATDEKRVLDADEMDEEPPISGDEDEDEGYEVLPGIAKFSEGCRAFGVAFKSIIKKSASDDVLGPILSGQKKLVVQKLAEEESEKKLKGETKKEKHLMAEKGHVRPANYLDAHEKFLIGVATKGVVKLFNAVNKAQIAQKGLNPSTFKDAKAIKKRRKEAFFTALGKPLASTSSGTPAKVNGGVENELPSWAPLRDNYMLTSSKLKNWDKAQETTSVEEDLGKLSGDSGSDDD